jgi:nicotinate-nucleotide adenylyltransferase
MGGTFDPIHYGHLFIAEEARVCSSLDKILFLPNGNPPHKSEAQVTSAQHRYQMTALAIADNPHFEISDRELRREGKAYAYDTLLELRAAYPKAELFYITGVDAFADFTTWYRHEDVIQMATFLIATRPGYAPDILKERLPAPYLERVAFLTETRLDISSTELRDRVRKGLNIRYLTPPAVLKAIYEEGLYRP